MNGNRNSRAQSAMEYLMTYGWAILIIAVVLAALFSLNVFNAGSSLGTSCIGQPGFACTTPIISSAGVLSFTLGQGVGYTAYNVIATCISSASTLTTGTTPFNVIGTAGAAYGAAVTSPTVSSSSNSISSGSTVTFSGVQCYSGTTGSTAATPTPIGTAFTGTIWLGYTTTSGTAPLQYVKIATVAVKSSS
jgi:hypothetical protein